MNAIKKIVKIVLWTIAILLILGIVLVLTIPWWISPTAKFAVNKIGPSIVKTHTHLGDFGLNPYTGLFHMGDFQLENPEGFDQREMFTLGEVRVELDPTTVMSDVIHIKLIRVKDIFVSYVFNKGTSNVTALQEGMNEGKTPESATPAEDSAEEAPAVAQEQAEEPSKPKKVIIDRLEIGGIVAQVGPVTIPLTPNELVFTDIGKDSGGSTLAEAWDATMGPIAKTLESAIDSAKKVGEFAKNVGAEGLNQLNNAVDAVKNVDISGAADAIKNAGDGIKNIGKDLGDFFK